MKYVLYIDYRASYKPMYSEYRPMNAKNMTEAVIEADAAHDPETMYLIRIMEKDGKAEKLGGGIKAQAYTAIMEKRSTKWAAEGRDHSVKHFIAKFADWFEIA
jgi:hypothetical protein|nr:MAG TPA: hypothetical protein [Caudoviricetes sp.]